jgi:hypothetical protein
MTVAPGRVRECLAALVLIRFHSRRRNAG